MFWWVPFESMYFECTVPNHVFFFFEVGGLIIVIYFMSKTAEGRFNSGCSRIRQQKRYPVSIPFSNPWDTNDEQMQLFFHPVSLLQNSKLIQYALFWPTFHTPTFYHLLFRCFLCAGYDFDTVAFREIHPSPTSFYFWKRATYRAIQGTYRVRMFWWFF